LFCSPPSPPQLTLHPSAPLLRRRPRSCSSPEQKSKNLSRNDDNNYATDKVYHKNGQTSKYIATTIMSRFSTTRLRILMYCRIIHIYGIKRRSSILVVCAHHVSISITLYSSFFIFRVHDIYKSQYCIQ